MTAPRPTKKTSREDWHPAEIVAALRMKGWSLRQLALINEYSNANSLTGVLRRPWPRAERIVAEAIGRPPMEIWPTRYDADGTPNRGPSGAKPMRPANAKPSSLRHAGNTQPRRVA